MTSVYGVARARVAPFGLAGVDVCSAVFPIGRDDALHPIAFNLRRHENAAGPNSLGIGTNLLVRETEVGQRSPLVAVLRRTSLAGAGGIPGVNPSRSRFLT